MQRGDRNGEKYRKRICLCIGLFIICVLAGFMVDNFDVKDHSKTTVVVTLYTEPRNEISEELRMAIENLISGSFNGILRDNISIDIEYTEKE